MPRLRNVRTGAVVSCDDETAARLGSEWQPADKPVVTKKADEVSSAKSEASDSNVEPVAPKTKK